MNSLTTRGSLLDPFFKDLASGFYVRPLHGDPLPAPERIKIDVRESAQGYTVQAEIPGVDKEAIHVSIDGRVVTLSAEIQQIDAQTSGEKLLRTERYYGTVSRSFQLPSDVNTAEANAKYDKGLLTLTLPKLQASSARHLTID